MKSNESEQAIPQFVEVLALLSQYFFLLKRGFSDCFFFLLACFFRFRLYEIGLKCSYSPHGCSLLLCLVFPAFQIWEGNLIS
ncbi:MAG: hypothetical protein B7X46_11240 [Thiomonas sp. 15-66-11]|nr:MAG: hypothetical protein B7X46_11240 [Thiomonas sp. 15-66-11]